MLEWAKEAMNAELAQLQLTERLEALEMTLSDLAKSTVNFLEMGHKPIVLQNVAPRERLRVFTYFTPNSQLIKAASLSKEDRLLCSELRQIYRARDLHL